MDNKTMRPDDTLKNCLIGLYEKAMPETFSLEQKLWLAKQNGYDFMEMSVDETDEKIARLKWDNEKISKLVAAIREAETPILTMCLSGNRRFPIGSLGAQVRDFGINLIKDAVDFSVKTGIRIVQLAGYDEFYNPHCIPDTVERFGEALEEVTNYAASRAVMLAIENVDTPFMNTLGKINHYVRKVDSPWLKIYADIANLTAEGQRGEELLNDISGAIGNTIAWHIKDGQEKVLRNVNYGEGIVDFNSFFEVLRKSKFHGLFVMEFWALQNKDPEAYLKEAREYISNWIG